MDIAKFGVKIDPSGSVDGSQRVKQAIAGIGQTARTELPKLDAASQKNANSLRATGNAAKQAASDIHRAGKSAQGGFIDMTRGIMDVLDAAGLLNNGFGAMLRRTDSAIRGGQQLTAMHRAAAGAATNHGAASQALAGNLGSTAGSAAGLLARFGPLLIILGSIAAAFAAVAIAGLGVAGIFKAISASIPEAAKMEGLRVRLAVAMGSFDEADKKFKDLKKFADETPFSDEEVFKAGVALQSMTDGALSGIPALTAIGGAASQANDSFAAMAERVGQVFNGIKNGGDFIEQLKTLSNQGVVSGATLAGVKMLNEEAAKGGDTAAIKAKQWAMIYKDLEAKSVALILQSRTWNGLISTIEGNWQSLKAAFGKPIMDALKPVLVDLIKLFPRMIEQAKAVGESLGNGLKVAYQLAKDGQIGTGIGLALEAGIWSAFDGMRDRFAQLWPEISQGISQAMWVGLTLSGAALVQFFVHNSVGPIQMLSELFVRVMTFAAKALVFTLTFGLVDAFQTTSEDFSSNGGKAAEYIGKALWNALGQAIEDTINIFLNGMKNAAIDIGAALAISIAKAIPGGTTLLRKLVGPNPPPLVGPPAPKKPGGVDIFTPTPLPSASDLFSGGVLPEKTAAGAADKLAKLSSDALAKWEKENPDFKNSDLGKITKPDKLGPDAAKGTGGGGGGKDTADKILNAKPVESEMERLLASWKDLGAQIDQTMANAAQSVANNMTDAITGMIMGAKSAKQAFGEMATAIVGDITRMIIQMTIQLAIQKLLGMIPGGVGVAFQAAAATGTGGIAHTGGTVGQTNLSKVPKFHQGGGLSSEQNIRVDKGETVLTRRRSAELSRDLAASKETRRTAAGAAGSGSSTATIINVLDRNEIADAIARSPGAVVNAMSRNLPSVRRMVMTGTRA